MQEFVFEPPPSNIPSTGHIISLLKAFTSAEVTLSMPFSSWRRVISEELYKELLASAGISDGGAVAQKDEEHLLKLVEELRLTPRLRLPSLPAFFTAHYLSTNIITAGERIIHSHTDYPPFHWGYFFRFPVMAVDLGERHIGIALQEKPELPPYPLNPIDVHSRKEALTKIASLAKVKRTCTVVVGVPYNREFNDTSQETLHLRFIKRLQGRLGKEIKVFPFDESLTSKDASLLLSHTRRTRRKRVVHSASAVLIIQSFLREYGL